MRHRSIENRLKTLTSSLVDCLVAPLQEKMEEWRRNAVQMDRDHSKEYKRSRGEIKRRRQDAARLQKKVRKGHCSMKLMLDSAVQEVNDRGNILLQSERHAVRHALVEQRSQFCLFVSWFKPILDGELSLMHEAGQIQELVDMLCRQSADPYTLPMASEAVIVDVKGLENTWRFQTPPSSPGSSYGSRKSSFCSLTSGDCGFHQNVAATTQQVTDKNIIGHFETARYTGCSSATSQDSGFLSRDSLCLTGCCKHIIPIQTAKYIVADSEVSQNANQENSSSQASTPSPSSSLATWPEGALLPCGTIIRQNSAGAVVVSRPHTISASFTGAHQVTTKRTPLSGTLFQARASSQPPMMKPPLHKPPLPPRAHLQASRAIGTGCRSSEESKDHQIYYNMPTVESSQGSTTLRVQSRPSRPLSFAGTCDFTPFGSAIGRTPEEDQGDLTPRANGHSLAPPGSFVGCVKRRSIAGRAPPPPPVRRNSAITSATPNAPAVDAVRSGSRCATPVEETYSNVIYALNARLSAQQLNRDNEKETTEHHCCVENGSTMTTTAPSAGGRLSKSLQEAFYSLPYADCAAGVTQLPPQFKGDLNVNEV
ncbi:hypothetical protein D918_01745 [Trichuris suis]|nr:hypothetical protein D918_01745 [Trichuris suis]